MADTKVQLEVEEWVRTYWMPTKFGSSFLGRKVSLASGGVFDFDAVSEDQKIVATISTAGAYTASGKRGVGKIQKVRSDIYFLLLANAESRVAVLTEQDMFDYWISEVEAGRVPSSIEFSLAELPSALRAKLEESRMKASKEVSPPSRGEGESS